MRSVNAAPDDQNALYAVVQPALGALAADSRESPNPALSQLRGYADQLTGSYAAIVQGWRYGYQRDWAALAGLDPVLAQSLPSDYGYPQAMKLRMDWRIAQAAATQNADLAREAVTLADQLLPTYLSTDIYALRSAGGLIMGAPDIFAESLRAVLAITKEKLDRAADGQYFLSPRERARTSRRLQGMQAQLDSLAAVDGNAPLDPQIVAALKIQSEAIITQLNAP